jgi:Zn2+/Cd2+-exporting ATPase
MTDAQRTHDPRHRHAGGAAPCCADAHDTDTATVAEAAPTAGEHAHGKAAAARGAQSHAHSHDHDHEHDHDHDHDHAHAVREEGHAHGAGCNHGSGKEHDHDQGHGPAHEHGDGHVHGAACAHGSAAHDHDHDHDHAAGDCCAPAALTLAPLPVAQATASGHVRSAFRIMQMDCPTEETLIRKKLGGMSEVSALEFNLMQRMLTVEHVPDAQPAIESAIRSLGMTPEAATAGAPAARAADAPAKPWWPLALAGVAAIASEGATWAALPVWLAAALALAAVLACGLTTYKKGWIAIRNGNLNINALMSIAVTGAMLISRKQRW